MKTVWKYQIPTNDITFKLDMPHDAKILRVDVQAGVPIFWAEVLSQWSREERKFRIVGTGTPIPFDEQVEYLGTWQQGYFVFHLYEVKDG